MKWQLLRDDGHLVLCGSLEGKLAKFVENGYGKLWVFAVIATNEKFILSNRTNGGKPPNGSTWLML